MQFVLRREPSIGPATLGTLACDGDFLCWTLEDRVREQVGQPVAAWKVAGETAIPAGLYQVTLTYSPRFGIPLPLVADVQGFAGIRIHAGNRPADTEGCILVGLDRGEGWVGRSREALGIVIKRIRGAMDLGESITLAVFNPPSVHRA